MITEMKNKNKIRIKKTPLNNSILAQGTLAGLNKNLSLIYFGITIPLEVSCKGRPIFKA